MTVTVLKNSLRARIGSSLRSYRCSWFSLRIPMKKRFFGPTRVFEVTNGGKMSRVPKTAMIRLFPRHKYVFGMAAAVLSIAAAEVPPAQATPSGTVSLEEIVSRGDAAYMDNKMEAAVNAYAEAFGQLDRADAKYADLIKERYARSLAQRAQELQAAGNEKAASEILHRAISIAPDDSHVKAVASRFQPSQQPIVLSASAGDVGRVAPSSAVVAADISTRTIARLDEKMNTAMGHLNKGRSLYADKQYEAALKEYQTALDIMPDSPATAERRQFILLSIGDASVAVAQELAKVGRYDEARGLLEKALKQSPSNKLARRTLEYLNDPERTNPAKTPQYVKDVTEVQRLLNLAYGHFDLGEFDDAKKNFQDVLRLDPYNTAARRGMEAVSGKISEYARSAYDQTRASALADVSAAWEKSVPEEVPTGVGESTEPLDSPFRSIDSKLSSIIIPRLNLEDVDIMEALDVLRNQAIQQDKAPDVQSACGVNITVDFGDPDSPEAQKILSKKFNLKMNNVPLKDALAYLGTVTGTTYRTNAYTVEIISASSDSGTMLSRVIPVPPGFFSASSEGGSDASSDPFATDSSSSGSIVLKRVDPKESLKQMGVSFPEGATVRYNSDNSTLFVRNTQKNIHLIEDIISTKAAQQPIQVIVKATIIEVNQKDLSELGFDWIINADLDADKIFGGGGQSSTNTSYNNQSIFKSLATVTDAAVPNASVTAGLRSINQVISTDSIDSLIANGSQTSRGSMYTPGRAPSILTVRGVWNSAQLAFVMRGLDQKKGVDVLQQPQVIVRPGESAEFYSGKEMLYPSAYEPPQIPNSSGGNNSNGGTSNMMVTPATPTEFASRRTGTSFNVQITGISEDKSVVDMTVTPNMVDFEGFINYGSPIMMPMVGYNKTAASALTDTAVGEEGFVTTVELSKNAILQPIFNTRGLTVPVSVTSGSTVVLGGLQKASTVEFEDKVPMLGDIPLVGRLFRSSGKQVERKVLMIMVKAEVVDPGGKETIVSHNRSSSSHEESQPNMSPQTEDSAEGEMPQP